MKNIREKDGKKKIEKEGGERERERRQRTKNGRGKSRESHDVV